KGQARDQIPAVAREFFVIDLGSTLDEGGGAFLDTAAVMMNLDLVITTDTSIAHLAGALGVPVWVALSIGADWRWLHQREDSPWYPGMRLFRQGKAHDWDEVFERMAEEVNDWQGKNRTTRWRAGSVSSRKSDVTPPGAHAPGSPVCSQSDYAAPRAT